MALPFVFASESGNQNASQLDTCLNAVGRMGVTQCTASGTNTIALTPAANQPTIASLLNFPLFGFVAAAAPTGSVNVNVNSLGALPLYLADGVTQAGAGCFPAGAYVIVVYNAALNSAAGGFQLISAAPANLSFSAWSTGLQSIPGNGSFTKLHFNNVDFCTPSSWYDGVTNFRYTPLTAGIYDVKVLSAIAAMTSGTYFSVAIFLNGLDYKVNQIAAGANSIGVSCEVSALVPMNGTTDYLEAFGANGDVPTAHATSNSQVLSHFSAVKVA